MPEDKGAGNADVAQKAIILYAGDVSREGYKKLTAICGKAGATEEVIVIVITLGGDAHAGYRMGRCLQHHFKKVTALVPDMCKSAGTLLAMSAHEVVMGDCAELGPLDVQVIKNDELFERTSGLDLPQSINALRVQVLNNFRDSLIDMRMGGRLSTKIAGELAAKITTGLFEPIFAQIDPMKLGELQRANNIGYEYGSRLAKTSKNILDNSIKKLITTYPSHGFVIDRKEATSLFKNVRGPDDNEQMILEKLYPMVETMLGTASPIVEDFTEVLSGEPNEQHNSGETDVRNASGADASNARGGSAVDKSSKGNGRARAKKATASRTRRKKTAP